MTREEEIHEEAIALRNGERFIDKLCANILETTNLSCYGRLHNIWKNMKQRCENPNNKGYKHYGGRGIRICNEWHNFKAFAIWSLLNGYKDYLTIDRIDNNGDYEPLNCRWVNYITQANNTTRNHVFNGRTIAEYATKHNIKYRTLHNRVTRMKMDIDDALNSPPYNTKKVYQYDMNGNFIAEYPSARIAAKKLGSKTRNHIDDVCRGKRNSAFGYKWKYEKI